MELKESSNDVTKQDAFMRGQFDRLAKLLKETNEQLAKIQETLAASAPAPEPEPDKESKGKSKGEKADDSKGNA